METIKKTHNYPKNRKPRDTSYSRTYEVVEKFGLDRLYEAWAAHGMYKASKILSTEAFHVSAYILRYLSHKHNWKRTVCDSSLPIYRGVLLGTVPAEYYRHIEFIKE